MGCRTPHGTSRLSLARHNILSIRGTPTHLFHGLDAELCAVVIFVVSTAESRPGDHRIVLFGFNMLDHQCDRDGEDDEEVKQNQNARHRLFTHADLSIVNQ